MLPSVIVLFAVEASLVQSSLTIRAFESNDLTAQAVDNLLAEEF